jgi:hypothetical protein
VSAQLPTPGISRSLGRAAIAASITARRCFKLSEFASPVVPRMPNPSQPLASSHFECAISRPRSGSRSAVIGVSDAA